MRRPRYEPYREVPSVADAVRRGVSAGTSLYDLASRRAAPPGPPESTTAGDADDEQRRLYKERILASRGTPAQKAARLRRAGFDREADAFLRTASRFDM